MTLFALFGLLGACGRPAVLDDYQTTVAAMRTLVDDHATEVAAASTLDEVDPLEASFQTDWTSVRGDMDGERDVLRGCWMPRKGHDMGTMMDDVDTTMGSMDDAMGSHMADHANHTDVSQCHDEELVHHESMGAWLDDMAGYSSTWGDEALTCDR
jgi:hypothetical protein